MQQLKKENIIDNSPCHFNQSLQTTLSQFLDEIQSNHQGTVLLMLLAQQYGNNINQRLSLTLACAERLCYILDTS